MPDHKYKIGQTVFLAPFSDRPKGEYVIKRRLPRRDGEFQYHIKNVTEWHEYVVKEGQLRSSSQKTRARGRKEIDYPLNKHLKTVED